MAHVTQAGQGHGRAAIETVQCELDQPALLESGLTMELEGGAVAVAVVVL